MSYKPPYAITDKDREAVQLAMRRAVLEHGGFELFAARFDIGISTAKRLQYARILPPPGLARQSARGLRAARQTQRIEQIVQTLEAYAERCELAEQVADHA